MSSARRAIGSYSVLFTVIVLLLGFAASRAAAGNGALHNQWDCHWGGNQQLEVRGALADLRERQAVCAASSFER